MFEDSFLKYDLDTLPVRRPIHQSPDHFARRGVDMGYVNHNHLTDEHLTS